MILCFMRLRPLLFASMLLTAGAVGCIRTPLETFRARPLPAPATAPLRVTFDRVLNVDYPGGKRLAGWDATGMVIEKTLAAWYPNLKVRQTLRNPSPEGVRRALACLPDAGAAEVSVVYLASRQTPAGLWEFPQGGVRASWADLLGGAVPRHPMRLVILDACHAAAVMRAPEWRGRLAPAALLAATQVERTYELDVTRRRPLDLVRRFPLAVSWLKTHMQAEWDGKISFLGFVWLRAYLETDRAPASAADWAAFIRGCQHEADAFRTRHNRSLASTVHGYVTGQPGSRPAPDDIPAPAKGP